MVNRHDYRVPINDVYIYIFFDLKNSRFKTNPINQKLYFNPLLENH